MKQWVVLHGFESVSADLKLQLCTSGILEKCEITVSSDIKANT